MNETGNRFDGNDILDSSVGLSVTFGERWAAREGCKIVAGGRRPPERDSIGSAPWKGARPLKDPARSEAGTPSGCDPDQPDTGGLRFASTSGYFLATLRVANARTALF